MLNPFKLFGSWAGAFIALILLYWFHYVQVLGSGNPDGSFFNVLKSIFGFGFVRFFPSVMLISILFIIFGFLLGWGLHAAAKGGK